MTLLAIDVGNTNTVIGLFDGDVLTESWRIKTDPRATADEKGLNLLRLRDGSPSITGVVQSSTVT